jgi:hypothetical protein
MEITPFIPLTLRGRFGGRDNRCWLCYDYVTETTPAGDERRSRGAYADRNLKEAE